jgi:hypothetical protein
MHKTLFIIESPFQLLSALEAIFYYKLTTYKILIRFSTLRNKEQLQQVIKVLDVDADRLIIIDEQQYPSFLKVIYQLKLLLSLYVARFKYGKYILGDYHARYVTLLRKIVLKNKEIIYLDDGSSAIRTQNMFTDKYFFDLFTMHNLVPLKNQTIVQHEFLFLKQKIIKCDVIQNNKTIILGDKFYEAGLLTKNDSVYILDKLIQHLDGEEIIYMAHRGESEKKLNEIMNKYKIKIVRNNYPIELYGLYHMELPKKIVSFFSTALFSMQKIYPNIEVVAYRIDTSMFTNHVEAYNNAYDAYEEFMKVINLA